MLNWVISICAMLDDMNTGPRKSTVSEKRNREKQLAETERLATLGKLASKVAHELNNPLDGILRYINLALRSIERGNLEKPKEYLTQCRQGLIRMVQIVSELLEFSRNSYTYFEPVKIEQIIEDAIRTMELGAQQRGVRILRNYSSQVPSITGGNLFQVFCNLIKNALDAMPDGVFKDTGVGFAPDNAETIFEPFFTTKDSGTGLGLAICKDIVERHNGRIVAEAAPNRGSVFTVYLPLTSHI